ncbi:unnamed protein product [Adineta steineri]|uniref:Uncharacterized protein n=1 Tax=Adineta steineri TaxID=433720 RepID=A0A818UDA8_9BILA|nr:unnamed protein product [Adineta steineri]
MKLFTNDKTNTLSSFTRIFHKLYHTIGSFNSWLIGLSILCLLCTTLFSFIESWTIFFYLTLTPYLIILTWSLPLTRIGSWKAITSIIHRLSGWEKLHDVESFEHFPRKIDQYLNALNPLYISQQNNIKSENQ